MFQFLRRLLDGIHIIMCRMTPSQKLAHYNVDAGQNMVQYNVDSGQNMVHYKVDTSQKRRITILTPAKRRNHLGLPLSKVQIS
jgi:hypothetical protein